jgi:serine/threonine protein kinase
MCKTNLNLENLQSLDIISPKVDCVLGDFSSAYNRYTGQHLYTRGPSRREQTDEYSPPEAIFGHAYNDTVKWLGPSFDSWSIGIVILELLLGTPNVFSVDQRTR